jgi:hypothetical protein
MADASFEAAVAMIAAGEPAEAAPTEAPTPEAPAAAEPAKAEPPPTEAPPVDEEAQLIADLEARKQARAAKQAPAPSNEVAELRAQLQALQAKLEAPQQAPDLRALIREHGEVEALRRYGLDPLEFFDGFKKHAKTTNPELHQYKSAAEKAAAEAAAARKAVEDHQRTAAEREQAQAKASMEREFLALTEQADMGLQFLGKMDPSERLRRTYAKIERLRDEIGPEEVQRLSDRQLAKLVDMDIRDEIRRLTGTDPGATTAKTVPATDGAKPKPAIPPASLTNDLASQSTGGARLGTDEERRAAAIKILEQGVADG